MSTSRSLEDSDKSTDIILQDSWRAWSVTGAAFVGLLFSIGVLVVYSFGILTGAIALDFTWSEFQRSSLFVSFSLCSTIAGPVWGAVADRIGSRRVVIVSSILLAGCFWLLGAIPKNYLLAHLVFGLVGLLGSGTLPPTYASLVIGWFKRYRGLALGIAMIGVGVGAFLLPPIAAKIVSIRGWRDLCGTYGMLIVFVSLPCALTCLRAYPDSLERSQTVSRDLRALLAREKKQARIWILSVFAFLTGAVLVAGVTNFVPLLQSRGEALSRAAQYQAFLGLSLIIGRLVGGALLDRVFAPRVVTAILAVTASGLAVFAIANSPTAYVFAAVGIGLSIGVEIDFLAFIVSRYFDRSAFTTIFAFLFAMYSIGATVGPAGFGWALQVTGSYRAGLLSSSALMLALSLCMYFLPRYEEET
ncbi:MFS transporter [Caballeronia sp. J97]|uniref:MFS transporter n=1 Tax=Caballeronia sp. J97 TaxID=2805429 RepID=UPI002AB297E7|nr:MFS transporter [Caballeronia sp. J97]